MRPKKSPRRASNKSTGFPVAASAVVDPAEVLRALRFLHPSGGLVELRALESRKGTASGYFDDFTKLVSATGECDGLGAVGVYITLNPIRKPDALRARSYNGLKPYARITTADVDIDRRRWLPIDLDPDRPAGISSTDAEHLAAIGRAKAARKLLATKGWPEPVLGDSGNGAHLLYRIDLPNDEAGRDLIRQVLTALAGSLDDAVVKVDRSTFNAARIWKLYGSVARKGSDLPDRPHRLARIISAPEKLKVVSRAQLEALAAEAPQDAAPASSNNGGASGDRFIGEFLVRHPDIEINRVDPYRGGRRFLLKACVFDPSHTGTSAAIIETSSGALVYKCQHNSCAKKKWADVREKFEPRYRTDAGSANRNGGPPPNLEIQTIDECLAEFKVRGERVAYWGDLLVAGELSLVAGRAYAGKSTFATALAKYLGAGAPFLSFKCRKTRVLYCALERNPRQVVQRLKMWDADGVVILKKIPPQATVADLCEVLKAEIIKRRIEVVIIDHLQSFARIADIKDYSLVSLLLEPLSHLARDANIHVMCLAHQPKKSEQDGFIDVIGSEAFRAAADAMFECRKTREEKYTVRAEVRMGSGFDKLQIEIDMATGAVRMEDAYRAEFNAAEKKVIAFLREIKKPVTFEALQASVELRAKLVRAVLKDNIYVDRTGSGGKGDAFLYAVSAEGSPADRFKKFTRPVEKPDSEKSETT